MNRNDGANESPRRWPRPRFSLFSLFLFVTIVCVAFAYLFQPHMCEVETLFQVSARPTTLIGENAGRFDAREFEILQQTQISLIKSEIVLQSALRDRAISSLSILAGKVEPVAWLAAHLEADFPRKDEVLAIRMRGTVDSSNDLKRLVDAIAKAYLKEVVYSQRQRTLAERTTTARYVSELRGRIQKKIDENTRRSGNDNVESALSHMELDLLIEQLREAQRRLESAEANVQSSERIRQIQPAVIRIQ